MHEFTLYAVVNYRTCGWCKKFRPVLEANIKRGIWRARIWNQACE